MLIAEGNGDNLMAVEAAGEGLVRRALLDHLAGFEPCMTVETWNGEPVLESEGQGDLGGGRLLPRLSRYDVGDAVVVVTLLSELRFEAKSMHGLVLTATR